MSFYSLLFWSIPFLTLFHVISPHFFFLEQNKLPLYGYQGNYRLLSCTLNRPFSPQLVYLSRNSSSIWWDDAVFVRTISGMVGFLLHQSMRSPRNKTQTFSFSFFFETCDVGIWWDAIENHRFFYIYVCLFKENLCVNQP